MRDICVIGSGFVGLTTAAYLSRNFRVVCTDSDAGKIAALREGKVPIFEVNLEELISDGIISGKLEFTCDNRDAVAKSKYVFLCLPTPSMQDGQADTSVLFNVIDEIRTTLLSDSILVVKSTVPVGTNRRLQKQLARPDCRVVSNPEFLREGQAVHDTFYPSRVVFGSDDNGAAREIAELFGCREDEVVLGSLECAEMIKYAANAYLAMRLSFVNELAIFCGRVGADFDTVADGLGRDPRIGSHYLSPGPGWGGSCFPKDTRALIHNAKTVDVRLTMIEAAIESNEVHQEMLFQRILNIRNRTDFRVGVLGLTFKAGTNDLRESPAMKFVEKLRLVGIDVQAFDPTIDLNEFTPLDQGVVVASSASEACRGVDVIVVLTEWEEFREISPEEICREVRQKNVCDFRRILNRRRWESVGFAYSGIFA